MNRTILQTQDLHFQYPDRTPALTGISLKLDRGRTTAVLGSNGAGKSTLFLNLNGILKPTAGAVYFNGRPLDYTRQGLKRLRQAVGMVFQDPDSQLFSASVAEDVSFGAVNLGLPEAEIRRRVARALHHTGIAHLQEKPTHALSFGQKKRAALAGVLVMEPEALILDEPTAGLDPSGVMDIMNLLEKTKADLGVAVVLATHDIDIVPLYCDYVYVLHQGSLVSEGTPDEVFARADLLRRINLRLPRIAHLMEILQKKDGFEFEGTPATISRARRALLNWRRKYACPNRSPD
jgi:cobalt/nickel transport system ATP-binding protein